MMSENLPSLKPLKHAHVHSSSRHTLPSVPRSTLGVFDPLSPFPSIPRLKRVPTAHTANLNTQHLFVSICRPKIRHRACLFLPWVPDDHIVHHILGDFVARLLFLGDDDRFRRDAGVDAIEF